MSLSFQQQGNLEEDRDKRRKFLSMVRNELKISQDELQQNRASLHSSFESKHNRHRDSPSQMEAFSQKLKPPKSPWQGNSSEKITHKLKEFQSAGIKSQYRDTYDEMQDRIIQENDRVNLDNLKSPQYPTNLESTLELSRIDEIWAFGGSSKMSTQNFTPYKKTSAKSPSVMNGEVSNGAITQKEHKMRLDKELVSLETRMIEFFEKEKKTILKENMSQITKMESKMKEKYNSVVKDILETKSRGSSFSTERLSHDSQNRQTRSNSPQRETEELSEKKSPTTATNTKSSFRNCNSGQRDRFLVKSPEEFAQAMKEIKLHLSYDQDNGDYIDVTNENKNTMPNKQEEILQAEIENKNEKISEMAEKIKDLEAENETLRKRVTLMEYLFKSDAEKKSPRNESSEKLNYDKFITPKMRDYVSRMATPTKQLDQEKQQFSNVEKKDEFVVKDFSLDIVAKNDNDTLVTELQEQIRNLNGKITALEKINKSLIEKDFNSKNKELAVREYERQGLEEKSNQSVEDQVRFWKERCGALTTKYFEVIRKLKSDNENLKEELLFEHKTVKKATVKELNLIQQAYQEKVTLLNTRLKHIEMQNKAYNNKHPRSSSSKGKEYY